MINTILTSIFSYNLKDWLFLLFLLILAAITVHTISWCGSVLHSVTNSGRPYAVFTFRADQKQRNVNKYFNEYLDPEYRFDLSVNVLLSCEGISLWQKILDCLRASILCVSYISYLYFTEQKRTV